MNIVLPKPCCSSNLNSISDEVIEISPETSPTRLSYSIKKEMDERAENRRKNKLEPLDEFFDKYEDILNRLLKKFPLEIEQKAHELVIPLIENAETQDDYTAINDSVKVLMATVSYTYEDFIADETLADDEDKSVDMISVDSNQPGPSSEFADPRSYLIVYHKTRISKQRKRIAAKFKVDSNEIRSEFSQVKTDKEEWTRKNSSGSNKAQIIDAKQTDFKKPATPPPSVAKKVREDDLYFDHYEDIFRMMRASISINQNTDVNLLTMIEEATSEADYAIINNLIQRLMDMHRFVNVTETKLEYKIRTNNYEKENPRVEPKPVPANKAVTNEIYKKLSLLHEMLSFYPREIDIETWALQLSMANTFTEQEDYLWRLNNFIESLNQPQSDVISIMESPTNYAFEASSSMKSRKRKSFAMKNTAETKKTNTMADHDLEDARAKIARLPGVTLKRILAEQDRRTEGNLSPSELFAVKYLRIFEELEVKYGELELLLDSDIVDLIENAQTEEDYDDINEAIADLVASVKILENDKKLNDFASSEQHRINFDVTVTPIVRQGNDIKRSKVSLSDNSTISFS